MNQNIINQYQLSFQNKIVDFESRGKEIRKVINTNIPILDEFLMGLSIESIEGRLIPSIEEVLSGQQSEIEDASERVDIIIHEDNVDFYPFDVTGEIVSMPTIDFMEIVIGWKEFLKQPPLNGSSVQNGSFI